MNIEEFSKLIGRNIDAENYAPFKDWDKEAVESSLIALYENNPSIKTGEIPSGFYRMVQKYYGGLKEARAELSLTSRRKSYQYIKTEKRKQADLAKIKWTEKVIIEKAEDAASRGLNRTDFYNSYKGILLGVNRIYGNMDNFEEVTGIKFHKAPPKFSDEELTQFIVTSVGDGLSGGKAKEVNPKLYDACFRKWGTWNKSLIANGFEPTRKSPRKDWTKEELKQIYLSEVQSEVKRDRVSNAHAIRKLFGGIPQLRFELGLDETTEAREYKLLSRISIDCYINQALSWEVDNINEQLLDELDVNLTYSIKQHYGSTSNYFSIIDIDRYKKPYTPFTWTKENIVWQIERWIREGYPVNYTAIQSRHKGIIVASRRIFGSYKKAFEYAQINYDDHRVDTAMASRYGAEFEQIVCEIFTELQLSYEREPAINGCHPDFVFGKHWVDAKLSEWTVSFADCSTIHKYLPNCRRLSIVYLRQIRKETFYTNELGVDMIHVSEILKAMPPQRAKHYNEKLNTIIAQLETVAA